jgi:lipoprotein-anchoring transpeptidase ErfK/SrfK
VSTTRVLHEHATSTSRSGRRSPLPIFVALGLGMLVLLVLGVYLYDHSRRDTIAKGVTIDRVSVGGLKAAAAQAKIQHELISGLERPVRVHSGSKTWTIGAREAAVTVDAGKMVKEAVEAGRSGSILTRTFRGLTGESVRHDVPLAVSYSPQAVRGLTAKIRRAVNQAPRNATVQPSASGLTTVAGRSGVMVDSTRLGARIEHTLVSTTGNRAVGVPTHTVEPTVTTAQLAAQYPAYIVIDRGSFTLRFYDHLKLARSYEIAVGMQGLETPAGLYHVQWEQVDPPWIVPNKAWAGALAGKTIPPGPQDPLKARFMSFDGGAGIHGIDPSEYSSIGHTASHGCVRMRIPDVIALYSRTPVGTPVFIV